MKNIVRLLFCLLLFLQLACEKRSDQVVITESESNSVSSLPEASNNTTELPANYENASPPISIHKATKRGGKPPLQLYYFDVEIKDQQNDYKWLLMPNYADQPLSESAVFVSNKNFEHPLGAEEFSERGKKGKLVLIHFFGNESIKAIRLPKQGKIKFDSFQIGSDSDISELVIWEARSLLVNGRTPVEDWLPYNTLSEPTVNSLNYQNDDRKNLDIVLNQNTNSARTDYPKEEIDFIKAQGIRKWKIPFKLSVKE